MQWTILFELGALFAALWAFTIWIGRALPVLQGKRILVLIAHPDDEAMFFAPTILRLTQKDLQNRVFILCFSTGDADGLGRTRKEELKKSALQLGITSTEHVVILEDEKFPDSMTAEWDPKGIAGILLRYFAPKASKTPADTAPTAHIDAIITFDGEGVSGHPNHKALFVGAKGFLKSLMQRHKGWECPTKLYTLTSTNIVRKYCSFWDAMTTVVTCIWRTKDQGHFPTPLVFMSGPWDIWRAQCAMRTAHKSQMRWFRWGWIGFSRYMAVNDLTRQKSY